MVTWKSRLALTVASVSLMTGSTLARQVNIQNANPLATQQREDSQAQEFRQLSESLESSDNATRPLPGLAPLATTAIPKSSVVSRDASSPILRRSQTSQDSISPVAFDVTERDIPAASMPTVIVRPPVNPTRSLNDLTVDVQKIVTQSGDDYSLQIIIPESVKMVEIIPAATSRTPRNFKIRVVETGIQLPAQLPRESSTGPPAIPVQQASASIESSGQASLPTMPTMQQGTQEPVYADEYQSKFRKNPFYQPPATRSQDRTDSATALPVRHIAQASVATDLPTQSTSSQATYFAEAPSLSMNFADSNLNSQLLGPAKLGLDDVQEFEARVHNHSAEIATEITVQLYVPVGLDVMRVDIGSSIDREARRITWRLAKLAPG
ncbi:MAG: hypothetical protein ACI814_000268, partial [Mariniblastus sp.]